MIKSTHFVVTAQRAIQEIFVKYASTRVTHRHVRTRACALLIRSRHAEITSPALDLVACVLQGSQALAVRLI